MGPKSFASMNTTYLSPPLEGSTQANPVGESQSRPESDSSRDDASGDNESGTSTSGKPSKEHNLITHLPKDPDCPICNQCKIQRQQCRRKKHGKPDDLPEPTQFAHSLTADHQILNEVQASRKEHRVSLISLDWFTHWLQGYPANTQISRRNW